MVWMLLSFKFFTEEEVSEVEASECGDACCVVGMGTGAALSDDKEAAVDSVEGREAGIRADEADVAEVSVETVTGDREAVSGDLFGEVGDG